MVSQVKPPDLDALRTVLSAKQGDELRTLLAGPDAGAYLHAALQLEGLASITAPRHWQVLAEHPKLAPDDMPELFRTISEAASVKHKSNINNIYEARETLLRRPEFPTGELAAIAGHTRAGRCLNAVLDNPKCPPEVRAKIMGRPPEDPAWAELVRRQDIPAETVDQLASHARVGTCWALTERLDHNQAVLGLMASNPHIEVRRLVAFSDIIPDDLLEQLSQDRDSGVRTGVAYHRELPDSARQRLAGDTDPTVRTLIADRLDQGSPLFAQMAQDGTPGVRQGVANNPKCPAGLLSLLAYDPERTVRAAVARNQRTATGMLAYLGGDRDDEVRAMAASNPRTPSETLKQLLQDNTEWVRRCTLANPSLPRYLRAMGDLALG